MIFFVLLFIACPAPSSSSDNTGGDSPVTPDIPEEPDEPILYSLTISVNNAEYGSVSQDIPGDTFLENTEIILTPNPADGYVFLRWEIVWPDADKYIVDYDPMALTILADTTITAIFKEVTETIYTVTTSIDPDDEAGLVSPVSASFVSGETVTFQAEAKDGYKFNSWTGLEDTSTNPQDLVITEDMNIAAVFEKLHTITVNQPDNGTISISPEKDYYESGDIVTIELVPDAGFLFDSWTGIEDNSTNPQDITILNDITLSAELEELYIISIIQPDNATINVSPEKEYYESGELVTISIDLEEGREFGR